MNPAAQEFWNAFTAELEEKPTKVYASYAGDKSMTDQLIALYLDGKKWAGSGLIADYKSAGDPLPELGDYWIILDSHDRPRVLCKTTRIDIKMFDDVNDEAADAEGEGDLKLWRKIHADFWQPFLEKWGVKDLDTAEVITEFFEVYEIKTSPPTWRKIPRTVSKLF